MIIWMRHPTKIGLQEPQQVRESYKQEMVNRGFVTCEVPEGKAKITASELVEPETAKSTLWMRHPSKPGLEKPQKVLTTYRQEMVNRGFIACEAPEVKVKVVIDKPMSIDTFREEMEKVDTLHQKKKKSAPITKEALNKARADVNANLERHSTKIKADRETKLKKKPPAPKRKRVIMKTTNSTRVK